MGVHLKHMSSVCAGAVGRSAHRVRTCGCCAVRRLRTDRNEIGRSPIPTGTKDGEEEQHERFHQFGGVLRAVFFSFLWWVVRKQKECGSLSQFCQGEGQPEAGPNGWQR